MAQIISGIDYPVLRRGSGRLANDTMVQSQNIMCITTEDRMKDAYVTYRCSLQDARVQTVGYSPHNLFHSDSIFEDHLVMRIFSMYMCTTV